MLLLEAPRDHSQPFCLIGEHVPRGAMNHLMESLVGLQTIVQILPNIPHIANDYRLCPSRVEGGDEMCSAGIHKSTDR